MPDAANADWLPALRSALAQAAPASRIVIEARDRPRSTNGLSALLEAASGALAAVPGRAVADTYKEVRDGRVVRTVPREALAELGSPWVFERHVLEEAVDRLLADRATCGSLIELCRLAGLELRLVPWPAIP
ncbi:MAG TPA: 2-C-methyl-D-erythritol 4-phosphate cytidylyltransferase [Candidatus Limnocylindrales bacterium]|nr:2-C-methyl-D-erythritol 4-phosphate cytidylyltransferase [Candidatus Limnocylindrales bacterium]